MQNSSTAESPRLNSGRGLNVSTSSPRALGAQLISGGGGGGDLLRNGSGSTTGELGALPLLPAPVLAAPLPLPAQQPSSPSSPLLLCAVNLCALPSGAPQKHSSATAARRWLQASRSRDWSWSWSREASGSVRSGEAANDDGDGEHSRGSARLMVVSQIHRRSQRRRQRQRQQREKRLSFRGSAAAAQQRADCAPAPPEMDSTWLAGCDSLGLSRNWMTSAEAAPEVQALEPLPASKPNSKLAYCAGQIHGSVHSCAPLLPPSKRNGAPAGRAADEEIPACLLFGRGARRRRRRRRRNRPAGSLHNLRNERRRCLR